MKRLFILSILLTSIIISSNSQIAHLDSGLVAYYPFNGNALDESGNGNNGTVNGATLSFDRFGNANSAYEFTDTSHYIVTEASNFLDDFHAGSISLWVNRESNDTTDNTIFAYSNDIYGGSVYAFNNHGNSPSNHASSLWYKYEGHTPNILATSPLFSDNWYHVVFVANGISKVKVYINGIEEITTHDNNGSSADGSEWFADINEIGNYDHFLVFGMLKREGNMEGPFEGAIDDIRIYNRALDIVEIQQLLYERPVVLDLKAFMEGPYFNGQMTPFINVLGFLPLQQPYGIEPWNYSGLDSVPIMPSFNIIDWILVELLKPSQSKTPGFELIGHQAGFILNNGQITKLDGISNLPVQVYDTSDFHIRIRHRNHLPVISSQILTESAGIYSWDFTTSAQQVIDSTYSHIEIAPGIWGMYSGNGNGDVQIDNKDKDDVWVPQINSFGYFEGDYNMDSQVDVDDKVINWEINVGKGVIAIDTISTVK